MTKLSLNINGAAHQRLIRRVAGQVQSPDPSHDHQIDPCIFTNTIRETSEVADNWVLYTHRLLWCRARFAVKNMAYFGPREQNLLVTPLYFAASFNKLHETSSSAAADKPARRAASRTNGKILKQSRDHNHAPLVGDMSSCCQNWYSLLVQNLTTLGSAVPVIWLKPQKNWNGSHNLTTTLSETVCHTYAVTCTCNLYIIFVVFAIANYESYHNRNHTHIYVLRGHSRSSAT